MKLLIKFPSRQRKEKFKTVLDMYLNNLSGKHEYKIIITADLDDIHMNNEEIKQFIASKNHCEVYYGKSKSKIEAINADMDKAGEWDVLLLASDDMHPVKAGYDNIIINDMKKYYPDTDGCLWYNEGAGNKNISMLSIMGKKYYDRFGYIYYPAYKSFFCDNEYTDIAKRLDKITYIEDIIIKHQHPAWAHGIKNDPLYIKNNRYWNHDKALYNKRSK